MATLDKNATAMVVDSPTNVSLTVRLIMQGKEVGSIIGKKGEIVKRFRDESGAKINISDGSCPERIVTVTGHTDAIYKAFKLICNKFEEDLANLVSPATVPKPPITFRLIVPASQCGSLIGKGGSKIKEIREVTGASIQVASEMLPNSTERAVTISGSSDAITQCIYHICSVMTESPPKGITVPYRPLKPVTTAVAGLGVAGQGNPVVSQSAAAAAAAAVAAAATSQANYLSGSANGHQAAAAAAAALNNPSAAAALLPGNQAGKLGSIPLAGLSALNGLGGFNAGGLSHAALAALAGHQNRPQSSQQTHEMTVPNELIGCIIGKGGSKIAEIRQLSGAMIRISNCEDRESGGNMDRTITISGNAESVALAQYLINMRISMETAAMGGMAGFQYIAPNHIIKTQLH
jgi:transcription antitermination factor NusA-like protein